MESIVEVLKTILFISLGISGLMFTTWVCVFLFFACVTDIFGKRYIGKFEINVQGLKMVNNLFKYFLLSFGLTIICFNN